MNAVSSPGLLPVLLSPIKSTIADYRCRQTWY